MAYDIGPRIGIKGEKEFNNSIKSINNSLKECGSEMNALTAKFAPSIKAYMLVPIVGSMFADFINSLVITGFINFIN